MVTFFEFLSAAAFFIMIIGLIKPDLVIRWGTIKTRKRVILIYGLSWIALIVISSGLKDDMNKYHWGDYANTQQTTTTQQEQIKIGSPDQILFHRNFAIFKEKYNSSENELQKSAIYREMATFTKKYFSSYTITNWEGKLKKVDTNEGGTSAGLVIESRFEGMDIEYRTWNNDFSDMSDNTRIKLSQQVYKDLEQLKEGDIVVFSGKVLPDSKRGIRQSNMTESGVVTDPEILVKFSSLKKKG